MIFTQSHHTVTHCKGKIITTERGTTFWEIITTGGKLSTDRHLSHQSKPSDKEK